MMTSLFAGWNQNKILLVSGNILLGIALIALSNAHVLPLDPVNFIFFSFVAFLFALYRPGWAFLFLVGLIPFETINLVPASFGIALRPYQWLAFLLFLAVMLRFAVRKLPFDLVRPRWFDYLLLLVPLGACIAASNAPFPDMALKQAAVICSFGLVYAVGRIFWQSLEDVRQAIPFFASSSLAVLAYALWQNASFLAGRGGFEVMAGRPNATFSEADWLGLFIIMVLGVIYAFVYRILFSEERQGTGDQESGIKERIRNSKAYFVGLSLMLSFVVLIITVARSAWIGMAMMTLVSCLLVLFAGGWRPREKEQWFESIAFGSIAVTAFALAFGIVSVFHLTSFRLFDRAESAASGLQRITIACDQDSSLPVLPAKIGTTDELAAFHCRHIRLEEIGAEQAAGRFIATVYRNDPNVSIRKGIYAGAFAEIRAHPITGIGWGSIASVLGTDERGAGLNASNVFLEVWLGSGLIGLIAFAVFWFGMLGIALWQFFRSTGEDRSFLFFLIAAWVGITMFDLFNSGILLGFFFLYLALGALVFEKHAGRIRTL